MPVMNAMATCPVRNGSPPYAPARIAENIDIGREETQSLIDLHIPALQRQVVLGPGLLRDVRTHVPDQGRVARGSDAERLGKDGRDAVACHAVQRLVPVVVTGNLQAWDRARII